MLGDRDYMRDGDNQGTMSLTTKLVILMVVVFALQCINTTYLRSSVVDWLVLTRNGLLHGHVWQLITFQFLHGGVGHILFNLLSFWWLGRYCEFRFGRSRFLIALLGCGAAGGLLQGVLMIASPGHFGTGVVGASAGVSGLLAIFALLERNQEIRLNFIFPIRAIILLYIWGGIALFFTLVPQGGGIAHAAHLGGILAGIAWVKLGWHHDYVQPFWEQWLSAWRERRSRRPARLPRPSPAMASAISRKAAVQKGAASSSTATGPTEFISREVDPILDKIAAHGIHSLTPEEKQVLEKAKSKIEKR